MESDFVDSRPSKHNLFISLA